MSEGVQSKKPDAQLIADAGSDPQAFGELYRRHVHAVHAWFRRRAPVDDASELTAETFAQAALSLNRFRAPAHGSAAPWLFGIAKNLLRRYYQREQIERSARERMGMPIRSYEDEPADRMDERTRADGLRPSLLTAIEALPRSQRDALQLRVLDELPYETIAARLRCSEVAARLRVMRALATLTRALRSNRGHA
jgi:RNA polymerase sigma factor (sigma-70 family)